MATAVMPDRIDQRIRRRRARLTQQDVADQFPTPISSSAVGNYERGEYPLPLDYTPEDYEHALARALIAKAEREGRA